ncbi:MAG: J domain-containing protein [Candidatus Poribacteria bacterium]|nr:J domain-containing protein [Candidatus Poribacteria bacterium]
MNKDKALSILGLDAKATPADIKSAYRRLARANHPDKMGSAELFKLVQVAYETLEVTVKADTNRKVAERIAELQRKIAEASEAKRMAEVQSSDIGTAEARQTLKATVEAEATLRIELVRRSTELKGAKWEVEVERPVVAQETITADWLSLPDRERNIRFWKHPYRMAMIAVKGKPNDDNDRRLLVHPIVKLMLDEDICDDLIEERIELTDRDFKAGGFFIWGSILYTGGYSKLAINHFNRAQMIKPSLWKIYRARGDAKRPLGYYAEAIEDYDTGLKFASHNQSAIRSFHQRLYIARGLENLRARQRS